MDHSISVVYTDTSLRHQAENIAKKLACPLMVDAPHQLQLTESGLWLNTKPFKPMQVDFSWNTWAKQRDQGKQQDLYKACKVKPGTTVIDATAGWGRDSARLACFGAKVIMLERHPVMQILLQDGLSRQTDTDRQHLSLALVQQTATEYFKTLTTPVDIIYLDPMHPARQKTALVKKDLQALQDLIGPDEDAHHLLQSALKAPCRSVVVKWPVSQPPLHPPSQSWSGKTVRYDCYKIC